MPIYEYVCEACGHNLEKLQKISDAPLVECPACLQAKLQKVISRTSFQLKGEGWYVTDFRNKNAPPPTNNNVSSKTEEGAATTAATSASLSSEGTAPAVKENAATAAEKTNNK